MEFGTSLQDEAVTFGSIAPGVYEVKAQGENEAGLGEESAVATVEVT